MAYKIKMQLPSNYCTQKFVLQTKKDRTEETLEFSNYMKDNYFKQRKAHSFNGDVMHYEAQG